MPCEQGFRSNDRGNLFQNLTSKTFRFRGKPATLVVRKSQPLITNLLSQNAVLLDEVLDDVLLPLVEPTGDGNDETKMDPDAPASRERITRRNSCPATGMQLPDNTP